MANLPKLDVKDPVLAMLVLGFVAVGIAIVGTNPFDPATDLGPWERIGLVGLGVALILVFLVVAWNKGSDSNRAPLTSEYQERLRVAKEQIAEITPERSILGGATVAGTKFDVINDSISTSRAEVIVSSDDNYFGARGGVAKAILEKAGRSVEQELSRYRAKRYRQGQLVITTGGSWDCRGIIHPAVIDLVENRYPDTGLVKKVVRRCLHCANAMGARSIAFPVLGGGTASKHLRPEESTRAIAEEILAYLEAGPADDESFTHIALYVYNRSDAALLPAEILDTKEPTAASPAGP